MKEGKMPMREDPKGYYSQREQFEIARFLACGFTLIIGVLIILGSGIALVIYIVN